MCCCCSQISKLATPPPLAPGQKASDQKSWVALGVLPSSFNLNDKTDAFLGAQGSVCYTSSGFKLNKPDLAKKKEYGGAWAEKDLIGAEVDFDRGTVQFFKNAVPLGFAFTKCKFDAAHYSFAVFFSCAAQVCGCFAF